MSIEIKQTRGGSITIKIPAKILAFATVHMPALEQYDEKSGDFLIPRITDRKAFLADVARQLECEEEDGTTAVHRMLDAVILEAIEQGAEGISMVGDDDYRETRAR